MKTIPAKILSTGEYTKNKKHADLTKTHHVIWLHDYPGILVLIEKEVMKNNSKS